MSIPRALDKIVEANGGGYGILWGCYYKFKCLQERVLLESIYSDLNELLVLSNTNLSDQQRSSKVGHLFNNAKPNHKQLMEDSYPEFFAELEQTSSFCLRPLTPQMRLRCMIKNFRKTLLKALKVTPKIADILVGYLLVSRENETTNTNCVRPLADASSGGWSSWEYYYQQVSQLGLPDDKVAYIVEIILGENKKPKPLSISHVHVPMNVANQRTGGSGGTSTLTNSHENGNSPAADE